MNGRTLCVVAAGAVAWSGGAVAAKPVYFHKAGVARDAFAGDVTECDALASGVEAPHYQTYSPNLVAAGASAFFGGLLGSREKRGMIDDVMRTCMADKGYRRVEASPELARDVRKLEGQARIDRLFSLASATVPAGTVLPR